MPWRYEPEGFELSDGTWYLPDFYLPTARAWAEVKGPHNERIDKVERFAADLWAEAGSPSLGDSNDADKNAPMVVILRAPEHDDVLSTPWPVGVREQGRRYSVTFAKCRKCGASTLVALWQSNCRNCGFVAYCGYTYWFDPDWMYDFPFKHLASTWRPPKADPEAAALKLLVDEKREAAALESLMADLAKWNKDGLNA